MKLYFVFLPLLIAIVSCSKVGHHPYIEEGMDEADRILGSEHLGSFSLATDRAYMLGHQDGTFPQAWNLYSYAVPKVTRFFGIQPDAGNKTIRISPIMPLDWDEAKIEKLTIGDNELSLSYQKKGEEVFLEISQKQEDWDIEISYPKGKYTHWEVRGENNRRSSTDDTEGFKTSGANITVRLK